MGKYTLAIPLRGIAINEDLGTGIEIDDGVFITNNKSVIEGLLPSAWGIWELKDGEERIEATAIRNANVLLYGLSPDDFHRDLRFNLHDEKRRVLHCFLTGLWMVEDSAVNGEVSFLIRSHDGTSSKVEERSWYTNARGLGYAGETAFDAEQIIRAATFGKWWGTHDPIQGIGEEAGMSTRLSRAGFFLRTARRTNDVGLRVALYCSSLEALLSTVDSGIKAQLAIRVALLLGEVPSDDVGVGAEMRMIYKRRSEFMHGDDVNGDSVMNLSDASFQCDEILRKVLVAIHTAPIPEEKKKLDAHFKKMLSHVCPNDNKSQVERHTL